MKVFSLVNPRLINNEGRHDLLVDGQPMLTEVSHGEAWHFALRTMADDDLYHEPHMTTRMSGRELRAQHNAMERSFASDGTYTPNYYPSPATGETEFSSV